MSTGPQHYAEAERLLALAAEEYDVADPYHASAVASAQVHATLALAAATALGAVRDAYEANASDATEAAHAWLDTIGGAS